MSLTILVTSPRVAVGTLTGTAWRALDRCSVVTGRPGNPLMALLRGERLLLPDGIPVTERRAIEDLPEPRAADLIDLGEFETVVFVADPGDDPFLRELATEIVRRSEIGEPHTEVEVMTGSYDLPGARLLDAVATVATLRVACPWDREQTHESLRRYVVEEAYEVVDAIDRVDPEALRDELGDLLFQVLFHAVIAGEERAAGDLSAGDLSGGAWDVDDVAGGLVDKLVRRHPHVFADVEVSGADDVRANWEQLKAAERPAAEIFDGVPTSLPALALADKVIGRMLTRGLALSVPAGPDPPWQPEHLGDVLFALVAAARERGIDAESALRDRVRAEVDGTRVAPGVG